MTYEEFLADEMSKLPHNFKIALENGTEDGSPGVVKYLIERIAYVRWEGYEQRMYIKKTRKITRRIKP